MTSKNRAGRPQSMPRMGVSICGPALAGAAYIVSILIFFRDPILSGFDLGFSDRADGIIEISILEHWRSVLLGFATWNQPLYFYPYTGTLGYNDGYFLSGLIYTGWRTAFDPFLSDTLTAFTYKTIGFVATIWLVRGILEWRWGEAVLIAMLLTISNNTYLQSVHAQIHTLALLPIVAALAILTVRREVAGARTAPAYAAASAVVMGVWLISTFYFAWFTIYFCVVLVACYLWITGKWRPAAVGVLIKAHWLTLAVFAGAALVAAIPFLLVYAPKRLETGGHGWMISYLVQPTDFTNVGEDNVVWGWLYRGLSYVVHSIAPSGGGLERAMLSWEHKSGFPLFLFALTCAAGYQLIRKRGDTSFARLFAIAIAVSWILTLRIWQVSPWLLVHFLIPASTGVRVVLRYQLFLVLPVLLVAGYVFRERLAKLWNTYPWLALGIVAILIAEQINIAKVAQLSRSEQLLALDAIPAPPRGCKAFYVVVARPGERMFSDPRLNSLYPHNVDAMLLAQRWRVPTINGFSTFNPPTWDFADPYALDYDKRVIDYANKHQLRNLCRLDMRDSAPWSRI